MKITINFLKYFYVILLFFSACCMATETVDVHLIENKLKVEHICTEEEAKQLIDYVSSTLTQREIAEAIRVSEASLSLFLNNHKVGPKILKQLKWYYENVNVPLSLLSDKINEIEPLFVPVIDSVETIENLYMHCKKSVLLPRSLKDKDNIKSYFLSLVGENFENIQIICETLDLSRPLVDDFLKGKTQNYWPIYLSLRNHYRAETPRKLTEIIEEYNKNKGYDMFDFSYFLKPFWSSVTSN